MDDLVQAMSGTGISKSQVRRLRDLVLRGLWTHYRIVSAFTATAFVKPDHAVTKTRWRNVADRMRGKLPRRTCLPA